MLITLIEDKLLDFAIAGNADSFPKRVSLSDSAGKHPRSPKRDVFCSRYRTVHADLTVRSVQEYREAPSFAYCRAEQVPKGIFSHAVWNAYFFLKAFKNSVLDFEAIDLIGHNREAVPIIFAHKQSFQNPSHTAQTVKRLCLRWLYTFMAGQSS